MIRFRTKLQGAGSKGQWMTIQLPFSVEQAFGSKARVSVRGTVNGAPYRSSVFPNGDGTHMMMINKQMQKAGGVAHAGDAVEVAMEADTAKRPVRIPAAMKTALLRRRLQPVFAALSYSRRKELVDYFSAAKQPQTKQRRLQRILASLRP